MTGHDPQLAVAVWAILDDTDRAWCRAYPHDVQLSGPRLAAFATALVDQGVRPVSYARTPQGIHAEVDRLRWEGANCRALLARLVHAVTGQYDPHADFTEQATAAAARARATRRNTPPATGGATGSATPDTRTEHPPQDR